jgi:hypothetical protein
VYQALDLLQRGGLPTTLADMGQDDPPDVVAQREEDHR